VETIEFCHWCDRKRRFYDGMCWSCKTPRGDTRKKPEAEKGTWGNLFGYTSEKDLMAAFDKRAQRRGKQRA